MNRKEPTYLVLWRVECSSFFLLFQMSLFYRRWISTFFRFAF